MINTLKIAAVSLSMAIFTTQAQSSDLNQPSILADLSQGHMVQHMTDQEKMDTRGEATSWWKATQNCDAAVRSGQYCTSAYIYRTSGSTSYWRTKIRASSNNRFIKYVY